MIKGQNENKKMGKGDFLLYDNRPSDSSSAVSAPSGITLYSNFQLKWKFPQCFILWLIITHFPMALI